MNSIEQKQANFLPLSCRNLESIDHPETLLLKRNIGAHPRPSISLVSSTSCAKLTSRKRQSQVQSALVHQDNYGIFASLMLEFTPLPVNTLTRICSVEYTKRVELVFEIIAEPNRRAILSLLVSSQQSVGEIARQLRMPQPTVSKHLRVLREAGFVESTVDAQRRLYRLKPEPLQEVDAWLAPFRRFWSAHVDALERHLDHTDQSTPTKRKTRRRRRGPNRERDKGETK
jgi:DNA-binding transcriptional ArsR family regulator